MRFFRCLPVILLLQCCSFAGTAPAKTQKIANSPSATTKPPNIILITLDTVRADRTGFLGSNRGLTPNLDALAKQSVVFARAYAQVPLTTPSHAVLLTGTYPQYNHVDDLAEPLRPELPYLPDLLHQHGYHTAAFVGSIVLDPERGAATGFDRGFEFYDANFHNSAPGEDRYQSLERRAEEVANHAMGWLSHHQQPPFFIWLHFYDAHEPYDPPEPFKTQYASEPYDGEIAYVDSVVGSVLEVLQRHGLFENTVIAVAADHGEAFGEHGERYHGVFLYDETIHVPLLLKLPGEKFAGKHVEARVALADVAPSLLQAARVSVPSTMQGQSLFPLIDIPKSVPKSGPKSAGGKEKSPDRAIYSESDYAHRAFGWSELRSWRVQKYLYVQAPKKELYDQSSDPAALKNLAPDAQAVADTLDGQLSTFWKKTSGAAAKQSELDPSQVENLRALGYLSTGNENSNNKEKAPVDPKDKIDFANKLHDFLADLESDRFEAAFAGLHDITQRYPADAGTAYLEFGRALNHRQKYQEALPILRTAVEKLPDSSMAHYELGLALVKLEQWEAALPEVQAAVEHKPSSAQLHFDLAVVLIHLKHVSEAAKEYQETLDLDPDHFQANLLYGRLLLLDGHPEAALPKLSRAVKVDPESAEAHGFLAVAYQRLGKTVDAERERAQAVKLKAQPPE
ncbi:MAG: sulfatase-like hydrolase/transferase [Terriglobales bacterium]